MSFVRLNSQGGFARLLDPTVDLREVNAALLRRSLPHLLWGTLLDRPPSAALEHILSGVGQSLSLREQEALVAQARRESGGYGVASQPSLLLDRAPCLAAQPLWLRPQLAARLWLKLHAAPAACALEVTGCAGPSPTHGQAGAGAACLRLARLQPGQGAELTRTPRCLRWVRTGYAYQPPALGTYRTHRAACPPGTTHCTYWARVPASAVPYVPRAVAPQAERAARGGLHARARPAVRAQPRWSRRLVPRGAGGRAGARHAPPTRTLALALALTRTLILPS